MHPTVRSSAEPLRARLDQFDRRLTGALAASAVPVLRLALGVVFLWFGALKFLPGLSPAQDLAARTISELTFGVVTPGVAVPVLAAWESLIGLGLITGRYLRATLLLLALQMAGTLTPLLLFPAETFTAFPYAPTLEGQYIIKNVVLIAAAMVVGATVRGGQLDPEPAREAAAPAGAGHRVGSGSTPIGPVSGTLHGGS
jgi:uncharacterized membrane protein YphA (DoxX/SURF4 family)